MANRKKTARRTTKKTTKKRSARKATAKKTKKRAAKKSTRKTTKKATRKSPAKKSARKSASRKTARKKATRKESDAKEGDAKEPSQEGDTQECKQGDAKEVGQQAVHEAQSRQEEVGGSEDECSEGEDPCEHQGCRQADTQEPRRPQHLPALACGHPAWLHPASGLGSGDRQRLCGQLADRCRAHQVGAVDRAPCGRPEDRVRTPRVRLRVFAGRWNRSERDDGGKLDRGRRADGRTDEWLGTGGPPAGSDSFVLSALRDRRASQRRTCRTGTKPTRFGSDGERLGSLTRPFAGHRRRRNCRRDGAHPSDHARTDAGPRPCAGSGDVRPQLEPATRGR